MSETFVEQDVDDEVHRRVEYDEHVGDLSQIELESAARPCLVIQHVPQDLVDERRHLADDEYYDDDNEDERHIVVLLLTQTLHLHPSLTERLQRFDQANVQHRKDEYGKDQQEYEIAYVPVYYVVQVLLPERRVTRHWRGPRTIVR